MRCRDKIRYRDEIAAKLALATARRKDSSRRDKVETRIYACPICHGWHLTSQTKGR